MPESKRSEMQRKPSPTRGRANRGRFAEIARLLSTLVMMSLCAGANAPDAAGVEPLPSREAKFAADCRTQAEQPFADSAASLEQARIRASEALAELTRLSPPLRDPNSNWSKFLSLADVQELLDGGR